MTRPSTLLRGLALLVSGLVLSTAAASAAVITGTFTNNVAGSQDFTNVYGTEDWIYYDLVSNNDVGASATPTNQKADADWITDAFAVGGLNMLRGSNNGNYPTYDFVYTDGTSPTSGTAVDAGGVFNKGLNTFGSGVGVVVTLPTAELYRVSVFVSGFQVDGRFSAELEGATTFVSTAYSAEGSRIGALYELLVTPDMAGDELTINFTQNTGSENGHTMVSAVGISLVPEPTTASLLMGACAVGVFGQRRRRS